MLRQPTGTYDIETTARYLRSFEDNPSRTYITELYAEFINQQQEGATVLDIGCGTGSDSIAAQNAGINYVGIDGSLPMITHFALSGPHSMS